MRPLASSTSNYHRFGVATIPGGAITEKHDRAPRFKVKRSTSPFLGRAMADGLRWR
jgi:hypothetical protein